MTVSMDTQCLLTNLSLVFVSTIKRAFQKPEIKVKKFPVNEIKMYNGTPPDQADRQGVHHLLPQLRSNFYFLSATDSFRFNNQAMELLTGKSATARSAEKVKSTLDLVDNTLGIHTAGTVQAALSKSVTRTAVGVLGKVLPGGRMTRAALGLASNLLNASQNQPTANVSPASEADSLEALKKLKELADAGVITQEEFTAKKKQLLHL